MSKSRQPKHVRDQQPRPGELETRRSFLHRSLACASGLAVASAARPLSLASPLIGGAGRPNDPAPTGRSRVVIARDEQIISVNLVQRPLVRDYLEQSLCLLTGARDAAAAWGRLLTNDDRILIKFNQSAAPSIGTTPAMAIEILASLLKTGFSPEKITLLEAGNGPHANLPTRPPDMRWQGQRVEFGRSGRDSFLAAVAESTAIINVPFLKTHHRAVMSGCLKNLSHGLIRHPARFHAGGCDPAIGEIVAAPDLRGRLKLNIVNALRVVYRRGPEARAEDITAAGILILGQDPVACDAVGYGLINEIRGEKRLSPLLPDARVPPQLSTANGLGVGQFDSERIEILKAAG